MGLLGDGSSSGGEEEDQLLQLPDYELEPDQADKMPNDHFFGMPPKALDIEDEIDQSRPAEPKEAA